MCKVIDSNLVGLAFGFSGALILFIFNNPYRGRASYWTNEETVEKNKKYVIRIYR